jgi:ketosteroid isomerase-like protein
VSESDNKKSVLRWIEATNKGDQEAILSQVTDDFIFKTMARSPKWLQYRWNKQEFAAAPQAMATLLKRPVEMEVIGMVAEGNLVVLEAQSDTELKNGKKYDNAYSLIFVFRDGKVCEVREYSCSHLVVETFGEFNPNNPQASKAALPTEG